MVLVKELRVLHLIWRQSGEDWFQAARKRASNFTPNVSQSSIKTTYSNKDTPPNNITPYGPSIQAHESLGTKHIQTITVSVDSSAPTRDIHLMILMIFFFYLKLAHILKGPFPEKVLSKQSPGSVMLGSMSVTYMIHSLHINLEWSERQYRTLRRPISRNGAAVVDWGKENPSKVILSQFILLLKHSSDELAIHKDMDSSLGK